MNYKIRKIAKKYDKTSINYDKFFKISNSPILSEQEEKILFEEYKNTKDIKIRDILVKANLRLVYSLIIKVSNDTNKYEDLFQEGVVGLINTIELFKPEFDVKFSSYATISINDTLIRYLNTRDRYIRGPRYIEEYLKRTYAIIYNDNKTFEEALSVLDLSESNKQRVRILNDFYFTSLDIFADKDDDSNIQHGIVESFEDEVINGMYNSHLEEMLYSLLDELSPVDKDIVIYRYGLFSGNPKTQQDIGNIIGLSRERVRQKLDLIHNKLYKKIKYKYGISDIKDFV